MIVEAEITNAVYVPVRQRRLAEKAAQAAELARKLQSSPAVIADQILQGNKPDRGQNETCFDHRMPGMMQDESDVLEFKKNLNEQLGLNLK
jgi:hypothetical protein